MSDDVAAAQRRMDLVMREHADWLERATRREDQARAESERSAKEIAEHVGKVVERLRDRRDTGWPPPERPRPVDDDEDYSTQTWLR
ncbi:hypothetical protein NLX83_06190 [Allokutzneria sp. A3M-2-11 16]|uniref:hypothetical protein n=1 Tax=Allokutzneria sp. A3M-2-11 16 TaxID=2962043 RepID=UPI0020B8BB76|nr:hypothetical protein [Allokutzneria sp. A3M-2-11 16]MCP3798842.1 hypothetical protein [Allokutzneria sp. A3M-2-11 16]